jgi:hypothetical protein
MGLMISRELAEFLEGEVGVHVGTRNARLEPSGARAVAVTVDADGSYLTVYVARVAGERLLPDLEANGQIAVSFARPVDEKACQVKGSFVSARDASEEERPRVLAQWESFVRNLELIGISRAAYAAWMTWPCLAIRLKPTAVFEQTPAPGTGQRIA